MVDERLHKTINFIFESKSNVLYFCNAGKDRTGVVSAILLYKSGKSHCSRDVCDCKNTTRTNNALYEVLFHTFASLDVGEYARYLGYQKFRINNCLVCKNYVLRYDGNGYICKMYKSLQIPKYEPHDTSRATTCKCFTLNVEEMENELKNGCRWPYTVLE